VSPAFGPALHDYEAGRPERAARGCEAVLAANPAHADALHLLGLIRIEANDPVGGIGLVRRSMSLQPVRAAHYNSLGLGFTRLRRFEVAVRQYRRGLALLPGSAEINNNLATALLELGRRDEAIAHFRKAAAAAPCTAQIWRNLADALDCSSAEAETCYRRALELAPDDASALAGYGRFLARQGRWAEAKPQLVQAITLSPSSAASWSNLGIVLQECGRTADAEACYRRAIALQPGFADAHYNLGCLLFSQGRTDEALRCHSEAVAADPAFAPARLALCMTNLPILYGSEDEVAKRRRDYARALERLKAEPEGLAPAIGSSQPFFLPYQEKDDRALQAIYGGLACRALAGQPAARLATWRGERIRLGIVSGFFCEHTLFKLFLEGWLSRIDRARFEVIGFHTGRTIDAQTGWCARTCDRFVQDLGSGAAWRSAIEQAAPHVLLYPEVGMDPIAAHLAAQRLAPVQCVTWGHPETTGLPTMDYFLSSALMERGEADARYTERLVRLPNLGLCYQPDESPAPVLTRQALGLATDAPVFWSGQALCKYLPRYDSIFPSIARSLGQCQFVFIAFAKSHSVTEMFRHRLERAFAAMGLDGRKHIVILPAMRQAAYLDAVRLADVILDTPGWSGGKSTLDCLATDPAIVTLPGRFMRGRHTAAILRRIGCEATVAGTVEEYVEIAVRLARDAAWRDQVRQAVGRGKHAAFADDTYVRALEGFLTQALTDAMQHAGASPFVDSAPALWRQLPAITCASVSARAPG
jgi:predicted O-linked N-acetylglucosamine transferase (SPINDLY family)